MGEPARELAAEESVILVQALQHQYERMPCPTTAVLLERYRVQLVTATSKLLERRRRREHLKAEFRSLASRAF